MGKSRIECFFGRHHYKLRYYKGIYGGDVAYLVCDCDNAVYRWEGKKAVKMIDAAIAKKKAEKNE